MKRIISTIIAVTFILGLIAGCNIAENGTEEGRRTITDMAGREVQVPENVENAYSVSLIGTIFLYTLDPDYLAGWNSVLSEKEREYILEDYHDLPALGTWRGSDNTGNIEEILRVGPDIIINMGDIEPSHMGLSDEIQEQLNIPVVMVDGSLDKTDEAYEFLGELFGAEDRAQELIAYSMAALAEIEEFEAELPEEERIRVYYGAGPEGLETAPKGSMNAELLDLAGGYNVADLDTDIRRMNVNIEQIIVWDPELIIVSTDHSHDSAYDRILSQGSWNNIEAVQNNRVYEIPAVPFDWFNRPPSVTRVLGAQWLTNLLYPEKYDMDIETEIKDFLEEFFYYEISDEEIENIMQRSSR